MGSALLPTTCQYFKPSGQKCGNNAIRGGSVCRIHGGNTPQVRAAADRRIEEEIASLRDRFATLLRMGADEQIANAISALERGGPGPLLDLKMLANVYVLLDNQERLHLGKATEITESRHIDAAEVIKSLDDKLTQIKLRNSGLLEDAEVVGDEREQEVG